MAIPSRVAQTRVQEFRHSRQSKKSLKAFDLITLSNFILVVHREQPGDQSASFLHSKHDLWRMRQVRY
jgi:hypothetical protein